MEELFDYMLISREDLKLDSIRGLEDAVYCGYGVFRVPYETAKRNIDDDIVKLMNSPDDDYVYMVPIRIYGCYADKIDGMITPGGCPFGTLRLL